MACTKMSESARFRIKNDLEDLKSADRNNDIVDVQIQDSYPLMVKSSILGPRGTTYENEVFDIVIEFSDNYPCTPPTIKLVNGDDHPDALIIESYMSNFFHNDWMATYTIKDILNHVLALFPVLDFISNETA